MSGGYQIGPNGVLVRPAEHAASTYTKPELPEKAKENTERGAEAAAEHYLALEIYAWNTGDTQPFMDMSDPSAEFATSFTSAIEGLYSNGWTYGNQLTIKRVISVAPVTDPKWNAQPNTIGVAFQIVSNDGITCAGQRIINKDYEYTSRITLFMTWKDGRWIATRGSTEADDES